MSKSLNFSGLPKKLYHGTSTGFLKDIAHLGLAPRGTKRMGNWEHTCLSRADAVYLTTAYALYYASAASAGQEASMLLEIDVASLNPKLFCSDEDGIAHTKEGKIEAGTTDISEATKFWRERVHALPAELSLKTLGNCAYLGVIPPQAISKVLILSRDEVYKLTMLVCDPVIVPMNYRLFGPRYEAFMQWLFTEPAERDDSFPECEGLATAPTSLEAAAEQIKLKKSRVRA